MANKFTAVKPNRQTPVVYSHKSCIGNCSLQKAAIVNSIQTQLVYERSTWSKNRSAYTCLLMAILKYSPFFVLTLSQGKGEMRTFWLVGKEPNFDHACCSGSGCGSGSGAYLNFRDCDTEVTESPERVTSSSATPRPVTRIEISAAPDPEPLFPLLQPIGKGVGDISRCRNGSLREGCRHRDEPSAACRNCNGVDGDCCRCYRDVSLLLGSESDPEHDDSASRKRKRTPTQPNYNSCLSLFQDCKKSLLRELKKDNRQGANGYRSAPVITLRDRGPSDCVL